MKTATAHASPRLGHRLLISAFFLATTTVHVFAAEAKAGLSPASGVAVESHGAQAAAAAARTKGYNCVFLGHSFFAPMAKGLDELAHSAGFARHRHDGLRKSYPGTNIFCVPGGKAMPALWSLHEQGKLTGIKAVKEDRANKLDGLVRDNLGHGCGMPVTLGRLILLAAIYQMDPHQLQWDTGFQTDLKSLAHKIVAEDSRAKSNMAKAPAQTSVPAPRAITAEDAVFRYDWSQKPGKPIVLQRQSITYLSFRGAQSAGEVDSQMGMKLDLTPAQWTLSSDEACDVHVIQSISQGKGVTITCGESSLRLSSDGDRTFSEGLLHIPAGTSTVAISGDAKMYGIELVEKSMKSDIESRIAARRSDASWLGQGTYGIAFQWGHWGQGQRNLENWQDVYRKFDIERFADLVEEMGAAWVVWSITWRGQHLSAPIKAYENVLAGYTMEDDFLGTLADALEARDIKLMFYYHPGHEEGTWWNAYTGRQKGSADRLDVDRSRWYRNFCLITQEIGTRYGHRLHGWLIDGARHYYPAPYETLTNALKAGNHDRIVAYNSYFFPRVTDFQDFTFGEGTFYSKHGNAKGIIQTAYHKGLQGHGMWILSGPDWGLFDPKRVPADPRMDSHDWLASLAQIKTLKVATSPCLTMTLEGRVNRKAYDLLVAGRRQFRGISDQKLIETRRARGAQNPASCSYHWTEPFSSHSPDRPEVRSLPNPP